MESDHVDVRPMKELRVLMNEQSETELSDCSFYSWQSELLPRHHRWNDSVGIIALEHSLQRFNEDERDKNRFTSVTCLFLESNFAWLKARKWKE